MTHKNKIFSPGRFADLLFNDLLLNHKRYLFMLGGAFLVLFLIFFYDMYDSHYSYNFYQYEGFMAMSILALGAFVGMSFPELSEKKRTANYLLLPASTFEKFLSQFLIRIVAGSILMLLIFWLSANLARLSLNMLSLEHHRDFVIEAFTFGRLLEHLSWEDLWLLSSVIFFMGTFLFTVRLFFKRFALVKTIITGFLLFLLMALILVIFTHAFYPETEGLRVHWDYYHIAEITLWGHTSYFNSTELFAYIFFSFSWLFFLPIAYFKLKEKEV